MKAKVRKFSTIALIALLTISLTAVFAVPGMPHQFWGDVTLDGAPAPDGTLIEAKIDGVTYESTTTVGGQYGHAPLFKVPADDPDTLDVIEGGDTGDIVYLYVGVDHTGSYAFENGLITELDLVSFSPGVNQDPVADAGGPYDGFVGTSISFDGSGSDDPDGIIASYAWTFGDGGTATVESPSHTYDDADTYTVTLTVNDDAGATHMDTTTATVILVVSGEGFSIDFVTPGDVDYGDTMTVQGSGVTAGNTVNVYWDYVTASALLNTTTGLPDGTFECEVDVPSDVYGDHYLWAKDLATGLTVRSDAIPVISLIKLSPSSGLEGDDVVVKGYGFGEEVDVNITFSGLLADAGEDETDELGYFEYTFEVEAEEDDDYTVTATDEDLNTDSADFKLGAAISLDIDEGPTGTVVPVDGRGWTTGETITFREETSLMAIQVVDGDVITVGSNGQFSAEIVIPELGDEGDYDIEAIESNTADTSSDGFELTGLPEIVVTPTYGTPGSTITVKGYNFTQIAGTEVEITLDTMELVTAETDSDGTFEDTFTSPAVEFTTYDVEATDEYDLYAEDPFKVGLIALIINPVYGEAGTALSITGIGFAPGDYNVTFGTILYEEYGTVSGGEAISDVFYVPNVEIGTYDILITDEDENDMTVEFRVTAVTEVTFDPAMAPNEYNVTVEGCNFADYEDYVDFVLYNATDEWDMDVMQGDEPGTPVDTCDDGNFTAWWEVLDEDTLSLGDYTINVTGYDDFFVQVPFSVVEARVNVAPRKALFDKGNTIQFNVKNDFTFTESYMKIWDPYDNLYWQTEVFTDWVKSEDLYTVPYYMQTSGGNPMELTQDAPEGTWFYVFYEEGTTQLVNGTFEVGPSAESLLTDQIAALSEELGIDIDTLRVYIDDLGIDMDEAVSMMAEDIAAAVSGMEDDISGLSEDLDDAVTGMQDDISGMGNQMSSLESLVDDISGTSTDAQQAANDAKNSADAALEAAEQTQQQTSGLTGLVYGAIFASLIAALAAVVSLMQISRRIAG